MSKHPNIVLIVTDDQRFDTIHALGNQYISTPNLDALCSKGTAFTNAHICGGTTGAICMPSRAMLHTGRSLFEIENEGQNIPSAHCLLGEHLKAEGYHCFGTGKWHNGPPAFSRSFSEGDNVFFGGMWDHWNVPVSRYDSTGEYDNVINFVSNFALNNKPSKIHCDKFNPGVHSSSLVADTAVDFIQNYTGDKPYFLYSAFLAPHDPRTMPEPFSNMYRPQDIPLPENFVPQHSFDFGVSNIRDERLAAYPRSEQEVKRHLCDYYGMISHLDYAIGRILQSIKAKGEDNTLVVFTSDNGLALGSHGLMGKQNLYEHSVRVPLVLAGADVPKGETCNSFVFLQDIFPTICEYIGSKTPSSVNSISFLPCLTQTHFRPRNSLYFAYCDFIRAIKTERYKLIEYRNTAECSQLFDLQSDPYERHNLYNEQAFASVQTTLLAQLQKAAASSGEENYPSAAAFFGTYKASSAEG